MAVCSVNLCRVRINSCAQRQERKQHWTLVNSTYNTNPQKDNLAYQRSSQHTLLHACLLSFINACGAFRKVPPYVERQKCILNVLSKDGGPVLPSWQRITTIMTKNYCTVTHKQNTNDLLKSSVILLYSHSEQTKHDWLVLFLMKSRISCYHAFAELDLLGYTQQ